MKVSLKILIIEKLKFYLFPLLCFLSIMFFMNSITFAQSKDKLEKDKKKIQEEIKYTNKLLSQTKKHTQKSLRELIILNNQISKREEYIKIIDYEIKDITKKIVLNNDIIKQLSKELEELKNEYAKMIYYAYKNRNSYDRLMFIFSSKDFNQAYRRLKYMQQYSDYRKKQVKMIQNTQQILTKKTEELEEKKQEKKELLGIQEKENTLLSIEKKEKSSTITELQKKEKELARVLREKEAAAKKLQKAIESIIAEEIRETANKTKKENTVDVLTPEELKLSNTFSQNMGKLPWPSAKGIVTGTFGKHRHPDFENIIINNNGIDISTVQGSKARAVFEGKVTAIISIPGQEKAIIIRHGDYFTVYSNLEEVYVKRDEKVKTKQEIGLIHTDAKEYKTELHFEIRHNENILNPISWLTKIK